MDPLLRVEGLQVTYHTREGSFNALEDVSFEVNPAEIVGIVGESGCGKSTVAAALFRLLPPNGQITAGQIYLRELNLLQQSEDQLRQIRGKDLAAIFQDPMTSLNPVFTVGTQMQDIQRAHLERGLSGGEALRARIQDVLERVGIPDARERMGQYPHHFSGGMRQRIMIAMALLSRPALMVADEPTSSLDVTLEAQILELMKELRRDFGTSIVFISHDLGVIAQLCDRVIVMYAGRVIEQASSAELFRAGRHPYTQALLASIPSYRRRGEPLAAIPGMVPSLRNLPPGCTFAERCSHVQDICRRREPPLVSVGAGQVRCYLFSAPEAFGRTAARRDAPQLNWQVTSPAYSARQVPRAAVLLRLSDVSMHYRQPRSLADRLMGRPTSVVHAVDHVSLDIRRGEVVGLVGESGSGKTTLSKTIVGLLPCTGGRVEYDGLDLAAARRGELHHMRLRMQLIFQELYASLSPRLRVATLLREPYLIHRLPAAERLTVSHLLEMVGLSGEQADKFPHELSGGQVRRVGIARALALRPEFLIADEPTSGLDVSVAAKILNLMKDLAAQLGLTYLIITHNLNVVGYLSHRLAVMYLGALVEVGPTTQIFEAPAHPYTLALLSAIPEPDQAVRSSAARLLLQGEIPSPKNLPPGCRFHTRCPFVEERCRLEIPPWREIEPEHWTACLLWEKVRQHTLDNAA
jgi:peptide/nickel transport system ATP-binding protein